MGGPLLFKFLERSSLLILLVEDVMFRNHFCDGEQTTHSPGGVWSVSMHPFLDSSNINQIQMADGNLLYCLPHKCLVCLENLTFLQRIAICPSSLVGRGSRSKKGQRCRCPGTLLFITSPFMQRGACSVLIGLL